MPNIVQAEFFHVGGKRIVTLTDLLKECWSRALDNALLVETGMEPSLSGIKTVVRFHDFSGAMTRLVQEYQQADTRATLIFEKFFSEPRWWKRKWLEYCHTKCFRKARRLKRLCSQRVQNELLNRAPAEIAVEYSDDTGRKFRMVRANEYHEIREAIRKSKNDWIFVFEPRALLAVNSLTLIARSM